MRLPLVQIEWIVQAALGLAAVSLLLTLWMARRQSRLLQRYRMLLRTPAGADLEALLLAHDSSLEQADQRISRLESGVQQIMQQNLTHIQHLGVVRFNAFPDAGSDLCFAIAVLDAQQNGVVLSSIYSRTECRTYAKPITAGTSKYPLSDEEKAAMAQAIAR